MIFDTDVMIWPFAATQRRLTRLTMRRRDPFPPSPIWNFCKVSGTRWKCFRRSVFSRRLALQRCLLLRKSRLMPFPSWRLPRSKTTSAYLMRSSSPPRSRQATRSSATTQSTSRKFHSSTLSCFVREERGRRSGGRDRRLRLAVRIYLVPFSMQTEHGCSIVGTTIKNADDRNYVLRNGEDCNGILSA